MEDDAEITNNIEHILSNNHIKHPDFASKGGVRLGQYSSCNLYNKMCVENILKTITSYSIDRNPDHFLSNIAPSKQKQVPVNLLCGLKGVSLLTKMNSSVSNNSMLTKMNKVNLQK